MPSVPSNGEKRPPAGAPLIGGFYVNWDDNSYASLDANLKQLDLVVLEWAFVARGGDSLRLDTLNGKRAMARVLEEPVEKRPRLLVMVSNFNSLAQEFGKQELRALLSRPEARARAIAQLTQVVRANGLAGVLVDFEVADNFPHLHELSMTFTRELRATLRPLGKTVAYAIPASSDDAQDTIAVLVAHELVGERCAREAQGRGGLVGVELERGAQAPVEHRLVAAPGFVHREPAVLRRSRPCDRGDRAARQADTDGRGVRV